MKTSDCSRPRSSADDSAINRPDVNLANSSHKRSSNSRPPQPVQINGKTANHSFRHVWNRPSLVLTFRAAGETEGGLNLPGPRTPHARQTTERLSPLRSVFSPCLSSLTHPQPHPHPHRHDPLLPPTTLARPDSPTRISKVLSDSIPVQLVS